MGGDRAARGGAVGGADDHLAADRHGAGGVGPVAGHGLVPERLAGLDVQGDQMLAVRGQEQLVAFQRDHALELDPLAGRGRVAPEHVAVGRVERHHAFIRRLDEEDAVMLERGVLHGSGPQRPAPGQPQILHIGPVHLLQWRKAPAVVGPSPHQPVRRRRVGQQGVADGGKLRKRSVFLGDQPRHHLVGLGREHALAPLGRGGARHSERAQKQRGRGRTDVEPGEHGHR